MLVARVDAREPEPRRQLGERDGTHAARRVAADLDGGELGVPERHQAQRDEPTVAPGTPLVDLPVVVRLDAEPRKLLVVAAQEDLPAEARVVREGQRRFHVVHRHVLDAGLRLPAAGAHLVERDAVERDLLRRIARGGDEPLHRVLLVLVEPPGHVGALGPRRLAVRAAVEDRRARGRHHDVRADVAVLGGQARRPDVGGFDDVVVEADDPGDVGHVASSFIRAVLLLLVYRRRWSCGAVSVGRRRCRRRRSAARSGCPR
jgi:hypothetical protein